MKRNKNIQKAKRIDDRMDFIRSFRHIKTLIDSGNREELYRYVLRVLYDKHEYL